MSDAPARPAPQCPNACSFDGQHVPYTVAGGDTRCAYCGVLLPAPARPETSAPEPQVGEGYVRLLAWAVSNCHTLARRRLNAQSTDAEWWSHVLRICEKAGAKSAGVLRAAVPTEITEGQRPETSAPPALAWNEDDTQELRDLAASHDVYHMKFLERAAEHIEGLTRQLENVKRSRDALYKAFCEMERERDDALRGRTE